MALEEELMKAEQETAKELKLWKSLQLCRDGRY